MLHGVCHPCRGSNLERRAGHTSRVSRAEEQGKEPKQRWNGFSRIIDPCVFENSEARAY